MRTEESGARAVRDDASAAELVACANEFTTHRDEYAALADEYGQGGML